MGMEVGGIRSASGFLQISSNVHLSVRLLGIIVYLAYIMFQIIKNWFQSAEGPSAESKWDASTVTMQQPNSPSAPEMSNTITKRPVCVH